MKQFMWLLAAVAMFVVMSDASFAGKKCGKVKKSKGCCVQTCCTVQPCCTPKPCCAPAPCCQPKPCCAPKPCCTTGSCPKCAPAAPAAAAPVENVPAPAPAG